MTKLNLPTFLIVSTFIGCNANSHIELPTQDSNQSADVSNSASEPAKLSDRDAELMRFLLSDSDDLPDDRIYFLTSTPMDHWTEDGGWKHLPESFYSSISNLNSKYRPADQAYLKDEHVLVRETDETAWMKWITIIDWKSETEVTVEEGIWCCPLGGGASTVTYEKIDGEWEIKKLGPSWVS